MTDKLCYLCLAGPVSRRVAHYNIDVCARCWQQAGQGWPEQYETHMLQALARSGLLTPDRNEHKRLPRNYLPPQDFAL